MRPKQKGAKSNPSPIDAEPNAWLDLLQKTITEAHSADAAYLLADQEWTRRQRVHYVWWPGNAEPELHRDIADILDKAIDEGVHQLHVGTDVTTGNFHAILIHATTETEDH